MSTYARADSTAQWFAGAYPGVRITPNCGVLHTTESGDWPGYAGGSVAPNYTAKPDMKAKRLTWRAHFPDEMSSRALANAPGGVETNTANVVQVELVGTCNPTHAAAWGSARAGVDYLFWPAAPDWALQDVATFLLDMHARHRVPLSGVETWLPYPRSYGSAGGQRMASAQWRAFTGWCGHQHVPENDHGDPGALPFARILEMAGADMTPDQAAQLANVNRILTQLEKQIPELWMKRDPADPTGRHYVVAKKGEAGASLATVLNALAGNAIMGNIDRVADAVIPPVKP